MSETPSLIETVANALWDAKHPWAKGKMPKGDPSYETNARAALLAIEQSGYVVVPVEPTEGMLAASLAADVGTGTRETQRNEYAARPKAVKP